MKSSYLASFPAGKLAERGTQENTWGKCWFKIYRGSELVLSVFRRSMLCTRYVWKVVEWELVQAVPPAFCGSSFLRRFGKRRDLDACVSAAENWPSRWRTCYK